jgi:tetratricopeptide (TPR) repeat protein
VREGEALRQLNHPNIVGMVAAVEEGEATPGEVVHYLVMEYVEGGSLQDLLAAQGALPSARAVEIALDLADALTRAHRLGIIHRDLKPANVLLAEDGTPRLTDFGIAHVAESPRLTQTGILMGTVDYLSPEACSGETLDERTDIWAFGVLLYKTLTGERPFGGETLTAKLTAILTQPVPDLAQLAPGIPDALADLVYRMLEKDRGQRVPSVRLVGAELEAILKGREVPTPARLAPGESRFAPPTPLTQPPSFLEEGEPVESPVFVARERELAQLDGYLNTALAGRGRVVFVTGDAGQGKTALVQEFARRAQVAHPELVIAGGNCNAHTGIGDPYLPFREILSLLTGDVQERWAARAIGQEQARRLWHTLPLAAQALVEAGPDLIDLFVSGPALLKRAEAFTPWPGGTDWLARLEELVQRKAAVPGDPNLQQSALFEQYTRVLQVLAGQRPLLLVLDDLQWADGGSISLLFHLGRRIEGSRVLTVGTYRPAEVALGRDGERHPLDPVVNEFKRQFGEIEVDLGQAEGRQFVEAFLDSEPNRLGETFRNTLYRQTGGHPLSTVELLRDMQERGDLVQDEEGWWVEGPALDWGTLPARVEAVIAERIGRLAEPEREALRVASVEGEAFTAEVVARVLGADGREIVRWLSRLDREHRLVSAQWIQRVNGQRLSLYRFRHILFQRYLYNGLSEGERVYLHEDVGTALEGLYGEGAEGIATIAVQLAWHFQEAGIAGKAVDYLSQAGEQARRQYANEEAITYFRRALALLEDAPPDASRQKAATKLYESLGDVLEFIDRYDEARTAYQNALASLSAQDRIGQGRLHRKTGTTWGPSRPPEKVMQAYDKAETALGQEPAEASPEWWQEWVDIQLARAGVHYVQGEVGGLTELVEKVRPVVEQHGTPLQHADFFLQLVLMDNRRDRFIVSERTLAYNRAYLEAAQELGSLYRIAHARFVLGFNLLWRGEFDEAKEQMNTALELMARMGDIAVQTQCLTYLTVVYRKLGQVEEAIDHALRSLETATWVRNPMYIGAARANLAWGAWRKANLAKALEKGKAALESWQQSPGYPFQWLSLYPLIAVVLAHDRIPEAVEYARGLLEPAQQALPDALQAVLGEAIETWERDEPEATRTHLDRALELAQELGYL